MGYNLACYTGKNLALWNKTQKERLLQCRSTEQKEHTEQKEQREETKKQTQRTAAVHSTGSACCVSSSCVSNASKLLGFATGVSIVGYMLYKKYKRTKPSAQQSTAQHSTVRSAQEKAKSTSGEIIKKESDPFQMQ